jgi:hypothetical protein
MRKHYMLLWRYVACASKSHPSRQGRFAHCIVLRSKLEAALQIPEDIPGACITDLLCLGVIGMLPAECAQPLSLFAFAEGH